MNTKCYIIRVALAYTKGRYPRLLGPEAAVLMHLLAEGLILLTVLDLRALESELFVSQ